MQTHLNAACTRLIFSNLMTATPSPYSSSKIPFWRDVLVLRVLGQLLFVVVIGLVSWWIVNNLTSNFKNRNLTFGFDFLHQPSNVQIDEGLSLTATDSTAKAFWVGIYNSLRIILVGLVFATLVGVLAGISRLSSNWLINKLASIYVESLRNTPLLLQLSIWYFGIFLTLPRVSESIVWPGPIYISQRGVAIPWPQPTDSFGQWSSLLMVGLALALIAYFFRRAQLRRADRPGFPSLWALGTFLIATLVSWLVVPRSITFDLPVPGRFNIQGGALLSPEFAALLLGLVLYTGTFIAEIVRAGIQAVSKGQKEAASALGLTNSQALRLIVIPQALRVIIPPLTSQYLNLAKNSSLATVVAYRDFYSVASSVSNNTGHSIEVFLILMLGYLSISLVTSILMNIYNRRIRLVER